MRPKMTAEDRACLEAARQMVCGHQAVFVTQTGRLILEGRTDCTLNPSGDHIDALIVALSQAIKLHLGGVDLVQLRDDLVASGVREDVADGIKDHVSGLSSCDWAHLRARVDWYAQESHPRRWSSTADIGVF